MELFLTLNIDFLDIILVKITAKNDPSELSILEEFGSYLESEFKLKKYRKHTPFPPFKKYHLAIREKGVSRSSFTRRLRD